MSKPKYDSSRDRRNYTFHPGRLFSLNWTSDPGNCYLVSLSERQLTVLRRMVQVFPHYHWIWGLPSPRRDWDAATWDLWSQIENFVNELEACLMSGCDLNEFLKQQRMLTAAIVGEAVDLTDPNQLSPTSVDFTATSATPGVVPSLKYLQNLQTLGEIPGAGDTIQVSLQKLVEANGYDDRTLDDLITAIEGLDPGLLADFGDIANLLIAWKALFPGTTRVQVVTSFMDKWHQKRYWHNHLTMQAYQATSLRGIMRALAPFEDDPTTTEQEILGKLGSLKWLVKGTIAVAEPGPLGEIYLLADGLVSGVQKIFLVIKSAWELWFNKWINQVGDPEPTNNVTTAISSLSGVLGGFDLSGGSASIKPALTNIASAIKGLKLNVSCSCGGSGCGGCGGIGNQPPYEPAIEGETPPVGFEPVTDDSGTPAPPETPYYNTRKCKISNAIHEQVKEFFTKLNGVGIIQDLESVGVSPTVAITLIIGYIIGELSTPIPILDGAVGTVVGYIIGIALKRLVGDVDLEALLVAFNDYEEDLVCALYNGKNTIQSTNDYLQVLADNGVSLVNRELVFAVLGTYVVNHVFFTSSDEIEAALDGYNGPIDCSNCEDERPPLFPFIENLEDWYLIPEPLDYPAIPNAGQGLAWGFDPDFDAGAMFLSNTAENGAHASSPVVNYYLEAGLVHTFEWKRRCPNVTYAVRVWFSDGTDVWPDSHGHGYPNGVWQYDLTPYIGKTVRTITLSIGSGAGGRQFVVDYINITSV